MAQENDSSHDFRLIRAEDIRSGLSLWTNLPRSTSRKRTSVEVSPGDIIGSVSGPYGRWAIVPHDYGPAFASDHTVVLKKRGDISMWYLLEFLRSEPGRELLSKTVHGTGISRLSPAELKQIAVPECPLPSTYVDRLLESYEEEHRRVQLGIERLRDRLYEVYTSVTSVEVSARLDALQGIAASMQTMTSLGDILWIAKTSYPYPIARVLRAAESALSPRQKYHEITHETLEALSITLACACAAVVRHNGLPVGVKTRKWLNDIMRKGATIGTRFAMVREVASALRDLGRGDGDVGGLGRALGDDGAPAVSLMKDLLEERNRIHGNYPRTNLQFNQRLEVSERDMRSLLEALGFLARWEFRYAERVEPMEASNGDTHYLATFRVLRGDNQDWRLVKEEFRSPLYRGRIYALVDSRIIIDMYPYMLVRDCNICGAPEVYSPDSFTAYAARLISIDRGHSQEVEDKALVRALEAAFS